MNTTQMNKFLDEIVEKFNGQEFTIDDIKNLDTFAEPKKIKKKKDSNAPKRASTAWIFYTSETRIKLREENPDKKMTELTTIMSEMWRNLSDEDKEPYRILEGNDRKRYKLEKEEYDSNSDTNSDSNSDSDTKKKTKDPNAPKRNINAYFHFGKVIRAKDLDVKYTASALKKLWAELDDKSEYQELANVDKERYLKEKEEYENQ